VTQDTIFNQDQEAKKKCIVESVWALCVVVVMASVVCGSSDGERYVCCFRPKDPPKTTAQQDNKPSFRHSAWKRAPIP